MGGGSWAGARPPHTAHEAPLECSRVMQNVRYASAEVKGSLCMPAPQLCSNGTRRRHQHAAGTGAQRACMEVAHEPLATVLCALLTDAVWFTCPQIYVWARKHIATCCLESASGWMAMLGGMHPAGIRR